MKALEKLGVAQEQAFEILLQARDHHVSLQAAIDAMIKIIAERDEKEDG